MTAGLPDTLTDPRGIVTKTYYDALSRVTKTIEAFTNGVPTTSTNRTTAYSYDGNDHVLTVTLVLPSSGQQTTQYVYGIDPSAPYSLHSNDALQAVKHPDPTTGLANSSYQEQYTYNNLGQVATYTDRNGTVHTYAFDILGRQTSDSVTTLASGVDGSIRRLETAYDTQGNPYLFTSRSAASGRSACYGLSPSGTWMRS